MKTCPICKRTITENSKNCNQCGTTISNVIHYKNPALPSDEIAITKEKKNIVFNKKILIASAILVITIVIVYLFSTYVQKEQRYKETGFFYMESNSLYYFNDKSNQSTLILMNYMDKLIGSRSSTLSLSENTNNQLIKDTIFHNRQYLYYIDELEQLSEGKITAKLYQKDYRSLEDSQLISNIQFSDQLLELNKDESNSHYYAYVEQEDNSSLYFLNNSTLYHWNKNHSDPLLNNVASIEYYNHTYIILRSKDGAYHRLDLSNNKAQPLLDSRSTILHGANDFSSGYFYVEEDESNLYYFDSTGKKELSLSYNIQKADFVQFNDNGSLYYIVANNESLPILPYISDTMKEYDLAYEKPNQDNYMTETLNETKYTQMKHYYTDLLEKWGKYQSGIIRNFRHYNAFSNFLFYEDKHRYYYLYETSNSSLSFDEYLRSKVTNRLLDTEAYEKSLLEYDKVMLRNNIRLAMEEENSSIPLYQLYYYNGQNEVLVADNLIAIPDNIHLDDYSNDIKEGHDSIYYHSIAIRDEALFDLSSVDFTTSEEVKEQLLETLRSNTIITVLVNGIIVKEFPSDNSNNMVYRISPNGNRIYLGKIEEAHEKYNIYTWKFMDLKKDNIEQTLLDNYITNYPSYYEDNIYYIKNTDSTNGRSDLYLNGKLRFEDISYEDEIYECQVSENITLILRKESDSLLYDMTIYEKGTRLRTIPYVNSIYIAEDEGLYYMVSDDKSGKSSRLFQYKNKDYHNLLNNLNYNSLINGIPSFTRIK